MFWIKRLIAKHSGVTRWGGAVSLGGRLTTAYKGPFSSEPFRMDHIFLLPFGMALELPLACHSEASSQADYPVHLWAETDRPAHDCTVNLHMKTNEGMGWGQGQHRTSVVDILTAKNCSEVKEDVSSTLVCIPMTRNPDVPNTEKLNKCKSF